MKILKFQNLEIYKLATGTVDSAPYVKKVSE